MLFGRTFGSEIWWMTLCHVSEENLSNILNRLICDHPPRIQEFWTLTICACHYGELHSYRRETMISNQRGSALRTPEQVESGGIRRIRSATCPTNCVEETHSFFSDTPPSHSPWSLVRLEVSLGQTSPIHNLPERNATECILGTRPPCQKKYSRGSDPGLGLEARVAGSSAGDGPQT